jgi:hypothetical protein
MRSPPSPSLELPDLAARRAAIARAKRPRWKPALEPLASLASVPGRLAGGRSRRGLFGLLGGGAATALQPHEAPRRDPELALVQRITQGFQLGELERARAMGYRAYLEEQLDAFAIDDSALEARLAGFTTLGLSPKELVDLYVDDPGPPVLELKGSLLVRAVHSRRQLYERMCEFWRDHFHIDHNKGDVEWALLTEHERTVIRPHALGKFPDLLRAVAFSPAMQYYLDNWLNVRGAPQENYARELLELHTLGVRGGYGEVDVKQVARCFTGWTLNPDFNSPDFLRTVFDSALHAPGSKLVLGQVIPAVPGSLNAQRVLDLIALHPSTARFLARKLCAWMLTPTPPDELVERVAAAYLASGGDTKAMLRVILARENLAGVGAVAAPKFRRPFHLVVSILRALEAELVDPLYPLYLLYLMGHPPLDKVQPDGYPDTLAAWGRSQLPRWSSASFLAAGGRVLPLLGDGGFPGVRIDREHLLARLELSGRRRNVAGLAQRMNARLFGNALAPHEEASLQEFLDGRVLFDTELFEAIALGMSLPGYQWY